MKPTCITSFESPNQNAPHGSSIINALNRQTLAVQGHRGRGSIRREEPPPGEDMGNDAQHCDRLSTVD